MLFALVSDPHREVYGLQVAEELDLLPGTVYPILKRLTEAGWLTRRREPDTGDLDRPPRQLHRLTDYGAAEARDYLAHATRFTLAAARAHGFEVDQLARPEGGVGREPESGAVVAGRGD